jgi:hypothetical protein
MKRGVSLALVLACAASSALAADPPRIQNTAPKIVPVASAPPKLTVVHVGEPLYFDLAVAQGAGRGTTVYRYDREDKKLVFLRRVEDRDVPGRVGNFTPLGQILDPIIVLSPEGIKRPPPPPPPGDELFRWKVPAAELQAAKQALLKLEPGVKDVDLSIGQFTH